MNGITAAVISVGMERQAAQINANAALVREARRSDASVLQLLDAAKATDEVAGRSQGENQEAPRGKGSLLNLSA